MLWWTLVLLPNWGLPPPRWGSKWDCNTGLGQEPWMILFLRNAFKSCICSVALLQCFKIFFLLLYFYFIAKINKEAGLYFTRHGYWVSLRNIFGWWIGTKTSHQILRMLHPLFQPHPSLLLPITLTTKVVITVYLCCFSLILLLQHVCTQSLVLYSFCLKCNRWNAGVRSKEIWMRNFESSDNLLLPGSY